MVSAARTTDHQAAAVRHLQVVPDEKPGTVAVPPALIALFRIPFAVAVTADVWAEVITWSHPSGTGHRHQSEEARLTDLLWMVTVVAAAPITPGRARRFTMWRVPTSAPGSLPRRVRLTLTLAATAADCPPVATIAAAPRRFDRLRRIHPESVGVLAVALAMFGTPVALVLAGGR